MKIYTVKCFLIVFLAFILCGINHASADEKIIVKELPDEFSQNDYMRILVKTTYPPGSMLHYNFTLETPYPHRGKLSGKSGHGQGTRVGEDQYPFSDKVYFEEYIPGDWKLKIWEENNEDKAYEKIIHIYPAEMDCSAANAGETPVTCSVKSVLNPDLNIDPNIGENGGILAKGQPIRLKGVAPADSEIGVWIYSDSVNEDFPVFKSIIADCNGGVDEEILGIFDSYILSSGKYYVYVAWGELDSIKNQELPVHYQEFGYEVDTASGINCQRFDFNAEDPWISVYRGEKEEAVSGTSLTFEGETNLDEGTKFEVLINPTAVDAESFGDLIKTTVTVEDGGYPNRWIYNIDTSSLGAGEYRISVESLQGLGEATAIFNIYDPGYEVDNPGADCLSVTSYDVDEDTKCLKACSGIISSDSLEIPVKSFSNCQSPNPAIPSALADPMNTGGMAVQVGVVMGISFFAVRRL